MTGFREYLIFSEKQIDQAEVCFGTSDMSLYLIPSVLLSWIAIEAFVNSIIDDLNQVPANMFSLHEKAFLLEKRLVFSDKGKDLGRFTIDRTSEYRRLEEKIFFLIVKFGKADGHLKGKALWQEFERFKEDRNSIVHPRRSSGFVMDIDKAKYYLSVSKDIINFISKKVWKKKIEF